MVERNLLTRDQARRVIQNAATQIGRSQSPHAREAHVVLVDMLRERLPEN
jgi:hypothetical protein